MCYCTFFKSRLFLRYSSTAELSLPAVSCAAQAVKQPIRYLRYVHYLIPTVRDFVAVPHPLAVDAAELIEQDQQAREVALSDLANAGIDGL